MGKIGNSIRYPLGLVHGVIALVLIAALMTACGGGDGGGDSAGAAKAGIFVDSTVEGLEYETPTYSGVTDKSGTYKYAEGETVSFFIGDLFIGEARTKAVISPLDLVPDAVNETHPAVINTARLLQTMDWDGNSDNGITITALARKTLTGVYSINFDQSTDDFSNDPNVQALLDDLNNADVFGMEKRMLNDADSAMSHLQHTLQEHPSITIKAPNGGEALMAEDDCEITWKAVSFITDVAILVSTDGGVTWNEPPITDSTPNDGSYIWDAVPFTLKSTQCRFRIADADAIAENESIATASAKVIHDDTDNDFTIHLTKGKVMELIQTSIAEDSDNDYLPDDVEQLLGTSPHNRDSDNDGIFDYDEIIGGTGYRPDQPLADQDNDGIIAALDADEDDDNINDGELIDTDEDGIPNYLEYYGYTYDWFSDTYSLWDGITKDVLYFKTDPLQPSTDQDPYSDATEASGRLMDVLINRPGDLPMVPAYPNIVVRLESYDITLNAEISYAEGESIAKERNWSMETSVEQAIEAGLSWEAGVKGKIGLEPEVEISTKIGTSLSGTNTTGTTKSTGGSITKESNWQRAISSNPSEAARMKLKLKVYNYGTAAASNIAPTLTMKIGGMSVFTFTPADPINILEPGGIYPPQEGTYWVVDKTNSGDDINLTIDELRAVECGAPVSISVTQMSADVMLMNPAGQWESAGDWSQYMARCEAVCSNIKLDIGNGRFIHQLVYSDDAQTAPQVTLGDALRWIAYFDDNSNDPKITFINEFGLPQQVSLSEWNFIFDKQTLIKNKIPLDQNSPASEINLTDIVLGPYTSIIARAPRETVGLTEPEIYFAYFDIKENLIKVSAGDYNGITKATFFDNCNREHTMVEVLSGSGMFIFDTSGIQNCDEDGPYEPLYLDDEGTLLETVTVTNKDGTTSAPYPLKATYVPERTPEPLKIIGVSISTTSRRIDAIIDYDPYFPPGKDKVYFFHPDLGMTKGEALTKHTMYWHPDYWNHWTGTYSDEWNISAENLAGMWIIAEVDVDDPTCVIDPTIKEEMSTPCFASYIVKESDVREGTCGSGSLSLSGYFTSIFVASANYHVVDFDVKSGDECVSQADYIRDKVHIGFNYGNKYDLAFLPYADMTEIWAPHDFVNIDDIDDDDDPSFEDIDDAYIRTYLSGSDDFKAGPFYQHLIPKLYSYVDHPASTWVLKTNNDNKDVDKYVVIKIKSASGRDYFSGFFAHFSHHAELSYAIFEIPK